MLFAFFCFGISRTVAYPSLQNRIKSDVCAKYQSLYIPKHQGPCHIPGKSPCSIGRHEEQDFNDAVNAINFFRYLNGLEADFESNEKKSANLSFALIISAGVAGIAVIALIGYVIVSKKNQKQYVPI